MLLTRKLKRLPHHIMSPIREFFLDSRAGGVVLICCTVASLLLSNLPATRSAWLGFWHIEVHGFAGIPLPENLTLWVNDVLMTIFFFLVGMEIKRELTIGELASIKKSLLPVMGALGGMLFPALIFILLNTGTTYQHGWGIPMATDIAFSLGVLSLLGKKVPVQLKIFLAALAIIDDLGAVVTIAIFYTAQIHWIYLFLAVLITGAVSLLNYFKVRRMEWYLLAGILLWFCLFNSGVHATISGVIMAFSMPLTKLSKLEHYLQKPVTFGIMPLFALANTAIVFPSAFGNVLGSGITYGIIAGLVLGKPIGIFLFSFIATRLGIATLPSGTNYRQLLGMGILGGIGFTMSIFTSNLAYGNEIFLVISKISIIVASIIAATGGYYYINWLHGKTSIPSMHKRKVQAGVLKASPEFYDEKQAAVA